MRQANTLFQKRKITVLQETVRSTQNQIYKFKNGILWLMSVPLLLGSQGLTCLILSSLLSIAYITSSLDLDIKHSIKVAYCVLKQEKKSKWGERKYMNRKWEVLVNEIEIMTPKENAGVSHLTIGCRSSQTPNSLRHS